MNAGAPAGRLCNRRDDVNVRRRRQNKFQLRLSAVGSTMTLTNSKRCLLRGWSVIGMVDLDQGDFRAQALEDVLGMPLAGLLGVAQVKQAPARDP